MAIMANISLSEECSFLGELFKNCISTLNTCHCIERALRWGKIIIILLKQCVWILQMEPVNSRPRLVQKPHTMTYFLGIVGHLWLLEICVRMYPVISIEQ